MVGCVSIGVVRGVGTGGWWLVELTLDARHLSCVTGRLT